MDLNLKKFDDSFQLGWSSSTFSIGNGNYFCWFQMYWFINFISSWRIFVIVLRSIWNWNLVDPSSKLFCPFVSCWISFNWITIIFRNNFVRYFILVMKLSRSSFSFVSKVLHGNIELSDVTRQHLEDATYKLLMVEFQHQHYEHSFEVFRRVKVIFSWNLE